MTGQSPFFIYYQLLPKTEVSPITVGNDPKAPVRISLRRRIGYRQTP
ncbi:MAG: hypothetical protein [Olavius algarvensis Delta 4 endosymbiont]|nr:MAG: hypothetical protein [Olavius algarvensis Delta 4 endosymbiont]